MAISANALALLPANLTGHFARFSRRDRWWDRFGLECAGPACPHRGKLWPSWLRKRAGVAFDGRWYCELGCLKPVLSLRVQALLAGFSLEKTRAHRFPLGLLLVNRGAISRAQLREAIRLQRETGRGRLGDWLLEMSAINDQQLTASLGQQWGCPVFPLERHTLPSVSCDLLPLPLLESARAVPAHLSSDGAVLHVAFCDRIDHTTLYAIEQMLGCRTLPCVASAAAITAHLEQLRLLSAGDETSFDTVRDPREMTSAICNYAAQLRAARLVVVRARGYLWVRFFRRGASRDLLFRVSPENALPHADRSPLLPKAFSVSADTRKDGVSDATGSL